MQRDGGPGGAGGAGNPTGESFTGPAQALEIYGDFAAAYTGLQAAATTSFEVLSFTTGNYLFVGKFQLNAAVDDDDPSEIIQSTAMIKFNGAAISLVTTGNQSASYGTPMSVLQTVLIPAYTQVSVEFDMASAHVDKYASGSLIGRIYRG